MEKLLKKWYCQQYQQKFIDENIITEKDLSEINPTKIASLISDEKDQSEFWKNWLPWQRQYENSKTTPVDKYANLHIKDELPVALRSEVSHDKIQLILNQSRATRIILQEHDKENILRQDYAREISNTIVDYLLNISETGWNTNRFRDIANSIKYIFPNEQVDRFFQEPSSGLIPGRFKNKKSYFKQLRCNNNDDDVDMTTNKKQFQANKINIPDIESEEVEASIKWLKNEANGVFDETLKHWGITFTYRQKFFEQNPFITIELVFKEWNVLKGPHGTNLILSDFKNINSEKNLGSIINWKAFITFIDKKTKCNKRNLRCKYLKELIQAGETNENARVIMQFIHLAHLFPALGNIQKIPMNKRKTPKKNINDIPSTSSESSSSQINDADNNNRGVTVTTTEESLAIWVATDEDANKIIKEKISGAGRSIIQPYIITVGGKTCDQAEKFLVILDEKKFIVKTGLQAIDLCYKIYQVFHANYPPASRHIWKLIEKGVYKMDSPEIVRPYMAVITHQAFKEAF